MFNRYTNLKRVLSAYLLTTVMLLQVFTPTVSYALTSGDSQPEFSSFEPAGASDMVDMFSGDFTYNLPLFELPGPDGGYPFNLAYQSGITMDQEASWVGLGWSLNPGAINRTLRGLPDDFNGQLVTQYTRSKPNKTTNVGAGITTEIAGLPLNLGIGTNFTFNNYRGVSMGLDFNLGLDLPAGDGGLAPTAGLGLSFDGATGAGLQPSIGFKQVMDGNQNNFQAAGSINSRQGLQSVSLSASSSTTVATKQKTRDGKGYKSENPGAGISASHSFNNEGYTPSVSAGYKGFSIAGSFQLGASTGIGSVGPRLSFRHYHQELINNGEEVKVPGYGFLYAKDRTNHPELANALLDFNRSNEVRITRNTPNLAIPALTPDVYSLSGQGTGGLFLAMRSDVGIVSDPVVKSTTAGGNVGGQIDIATSFGADAGFSIRTSQNRIPEEIENILSAGPSLGFQDPRSGVYETAYFKSGADLTATNSVRLSAIAQDAPVRYKDISVGLRKVNFIGNAFDSGNPNDISFSDFTEYNNADRSIRAQNLLPFTGTDVRLLGNQGSMFQHQCYDLIGATATTIDFENEPSLDVSYQLSDGNADEIAGYVMTNDNGLRYNYTLPVYNTEHIQTTFSLGQKNNINGPIGNQTVDIPVKNGTTDKDDLQQIVTDNISDYINYQRLPSYAHSYLLTAVLGPDYIDVNGNGKPDEVDEGYWVKFTYAKTASKEEPYKWKAPFEGASYLPGIQGLDEDDRGAFTSGARENYYLAKAETRSHEARFTISERDDATGVPYYLYNSGDIADLNTAKKSYKLDKIELYAKTELANPRTPGNPTPIQTTHFEYKGSSDELTKGVSNRVNATGSGGKLTLSKVYTTYKHNTRGSLSPYVFDYYQGAGSDEYQANATDRWGCVTPYVASPSGSEIANGGLPYVPQTADQLPAGLGTNVKQVNDEFSALWNLKQITLPSGAEIEVTYESDDFGYVQDRPATEMTRITRIGSSIPTSGNLLDVSTQKDVDAEDLKIYFGSLTQVGAYSPLDYVRGLHGLSRDYAFAADPGGSSFEWPMPAGVQVLYNIASDLRGDRARSNSSSSAAYEPIIGYAYVDAVGRDANGYYIKLGAVALGPTGNKKNYHPFAASAWQFLKVAAPQMLGSTDANDRPSSLSDAATNLGAAIREFSDIFRSFYVAMSNDNRGDKIDNSRSYLRLISPDLTKFGGGSRVRAVVMRDNWNIAEDGPNPYNVDADEMVYGQYYEYTTEDGYGNTISSGVAVNEPSIGYEACALKFAKHFNNNTLINAGATGRVEYPLQENLMPGAAVGYSRVNVRSLVGAARSGLLNNLVGTSNSNGNTSFLKQEELDLLSNYQHNTTGEMQHDFYTAKDFPIIAEETEILMKRPTIRNLWIPVATYKNSSLAATQGYSITLNDMHGKPREVAHFGHDNAGNRSQQINGTKYTYASEKHVRDEAGVLITSNKLVNDVSLISGLDVNSEHEFETGQLGVDEQMIVDLRENQTYDLSAQIDVNVYLPVPPVPIVIPVPNAKLQESTVKTLVTSKIIRRKGILTGVEVTDGQSTQRTQNLAFDPYVGKPLLTEVENSFGDPVYTLNTPAHGVYDRMGPAYKNLGAIVEAAAADYSAACGEIVISGITQSSTVVPNLAVGDELLLLTEFPIDTPDPVFSNFEGNRKFWINRIIQVNSNTYKIVLETNSAYAYLPEAVDHSSTNQNLRFKVIRSGRRNQLNTSIGSLQSLTDPRSDLAVAYDNALSVQAMTYSDYWARDIRVCEAQFDPTVPNWNLSISITSPIGVAAQIYPNETCDPATYSIAFDVVNDAGIIAKPSVNFPKFGGDITNRSIDFSSASIPEIELSSAQLISYCEINNMSNSVTLSLEESLNTDAVKKYRISGDQLLPSDFTVILTRLSVDCPETQVTTPEVCGVQLVQANATISSSSFVPVEVDFGYTYVDPISGQLIDRNLNNLVRTSNFASEKTINSADHQFNCSSCGSLNLEYYFEIVSNSVPNNSTVNVTLTHPDGNNTQVQLNGANQRLTRSARIEDLICNTTTPVLSPYRTPRVAFQTAQRGIFRPHQSYAFVGKRTAYDPATASNGLDVAGTFNASIFNYNRPLTNVTQNNSNTSGQGDWRLVNDITHYAPNGEPSEQRDAIGVYAASLYGYNSYLPTASASNARDFEIAFASFEDVDLGPSMGLQGNFNFGNGPEDVAEFSETYNIIQPVSSSLPEVFIDRVTNVNSTAVLEAATLHLRDVNTGEVTIIDWEEATLSALTTKPTNATENLVYAEYVSQVTGSKAPGDCTQLSGGPFLGELTLHYKIDNGTSGPSFGTVTDIEAHTGYNALEIVKGKTVAQTQLRLSNEKSYVLSGWVNEINPPNPTTGMPLRVNAANILRSTVDKASIEGWQRFEIEFSSFNGTLELTSLTNAYIDDLRLYPVEASFQSQVYDTEDYRLIATLDENNYATIYKYDAQGILIATLKETQRGLKTIQETRSYTKVATN